MIKKTLRMSDKLIRTIDEQSANLARQAVELALEGDIPALRACLRRKAATASIRSKVKRWQEALDGDAAALIELSKKYLGMHD